MGKVIRLDEHRSRTGPQAKGSPGRKAVSAEEVEQREFDRLLDQLACYAGLGPISRARTNLPDPCPLCGRGEAGS